jgi:galactokinase
VNLIGEHTDYNGGYVMPCAVPYYTDVEAVERDGSTIRLESASCGPAAFEIDALRETRSRDWRDYARGIFIELRAAGVLLRGAEMRVSGTLPLGAGLSSSASFEIAVALAALALSGVQMKPRHLVKLAQRAEAEHTGTQCGIMDQFAVTFGVKGHALFLDTRSLQCEPIPVPKSAAVVICNTMVKHELAAGEYNARRRECEQAVAHLRRRYPDVMQLRDVTEAQLHEARFLLDETLFNRALHVVTENRRVVEAARALRSSNLQQFGALMNESHESLRTRYAVSCAELDTMVQLARELPGVYGSRMTGGGFGGCTVTLVRAEDADEFRERIAGAYHQKTGIVPEIYDGFPAAGAAVQ